MTAFILGTALGTVIGVFITALCVAAGRGDTPSGITWGGPGYSDELGD